VGRILRGDLGEGIEVGRWVRYSVGDLAVRLKKWRAVLSRSDEFTDEVTAWGTSGQLVEGMVLVQVTRARRDPSKSKTLTRDAVHPEHL
jgi:hypothetical protein